MGNGIGREWGRAGVEKDEKGWEETLPPDRPTALAERLAVKNKTNSYPTTNSNLTTVYFTDPYFYLP